jgi:tetratricopeptide (TPR) repeat protein
VKVFLIAALRVILIVLLTLAIQPYLATRLWTNIGNLQLGRSVLLASPKFRDSFLQAAQQNFTKALSISPGDPMALRGEVRAYLLQDKLEQAIALLPVLKTQDPGNQFVFYELGFAHYKNGDEDGAFAIWRPYLPESAQYLVWKAGRFRAAGDLVRQEELLILAGRLNPQEPNSYYALGGYLLNISGQSLTQSRRDAKPQRFLNKNRVFALKP